MTRLRSAGTLTVVATLAACRSPEVIVEWEHDDPHAFTREERRAIIDVAERTVPEVRRLLPEVPRPIVLHVGSRTDVPIDLGENGEHAQPNYVSWQVNAKRSGGVLEVVRLQLRPMLFHELHHLVRGVELVDTKLKEHVVREGLACAFERDAAGVAQPFAEYPPEIDRWAAEVLALPDDAPRALWLAHFDQPDGRRWLGLRVGTYLVDRAMLTSGKSAAALVHTPTEEVLRMAGVGTPAP